MSVVVPGVEFSAHTCRYRYVFPVCFVVLETRVIRSQNFFFRDVVCVDRIQFQRGRHRRVSHTTVPRSIGVHVYPVMSSYATKKMRILFILPPTSNLHSRKVRSSVLDAELGLFVVGHSLPTGSIDPPGYHLTKFSYGSNSTDQG